MYNQLKKKKKLSLRIPRRWRQQWHLHVTYNDASRFLTDLRNQSNANEYDSHF